jgi:flagellar assembly protein FliH
MHLSSQFLRYNPPVLRTDTPEVVHRYLDKPIGDDFRMAEAMRIKTRIAEIEQKSLTDQVEIQVLERLKEVQERAYQEGFAVGQEDGRSQALEAHTQLLTEKLEELDKLFAGLASLKTDIFQANEMHFIKFSLHLAERIAGEHIKVHPESILNLIRRTVEMGQGEEDIRIRVAPEQLEFIEGLRSQLSTSQTNAIVRKAQLEADSSVTAGGCIVQTNYSEVDARIEERIAVLWEVVSEQLIQVEDEFAA